MKTWHLLRCHRAALQNDRCCWQHHPNPPRPVPPRRGLSQYELNMRPDAELLRAVYQQTDRIDELTSKVAAALARLERLEERAEAGGDVQAALNVAQAAE